MRVALCTLGRGVTVPGTSAEQGPEAPGGRTRSQRPPGTPLSPVSDPAKAPRPPGGGRASAQRLLEVGRRSPEPQLGAGTATRHPNPRGAAGGPVPQRCPSTAPGPSARPSSRSHDAAAVSLKIRGWWDVKVPLSFSRTAASPVAMATPAFPAPQRGWEPTPRPRGLPAPRVHGAGQGPWCQALGGDMSPPCLGVGSGRQGVGGDGAQGHPETSLRRQSGAWGATGRAER